MIFHDFYVYTIINYYKLFCEFYIEVCIVYNLKACVKCFLKGEIFVTKVAIILAPGFEEIEAITAADVFRRAQYDCDLVGFSDLVEGSHQIKVKADCLLDHVLEDYDLIYLPGGMPGAHHLKEKDLVIESLKAHAQKGGLIAAICAAPIVLDQAGLLDQHTFVNYPGFQEDIVSGHYKEDALVVIDRQIATSKGPATALPFAYSLVDLLTKDSEALRESMQYEAFLSGIQAGKETL